MINHHTALIYTMVLLSAADGDMTDYELETIGEIVRYMPIFRDYDRNELTSAAEECARRLNEEEGFDHVLDLIASGLPGSLAETAYAIACDVAAADGKVRQEEIRLLELLRYRLDIDRLAAAAIERGARARHVTL